MAVPLLVLLALQRTAVVNVVAIKRLSTLFSAEVGVTRVASTAAACGERCGPELAGALLALNGEAP